MTRLRKITAVAALAVAAQAVALTAPSSAEAGTCSSRFTQCTMTHGGSTQCVHEYLDCTAGKIRET